MMQTQAEIVVAVIALAMQSYLYLARATTAAAMRVVDSTTVVVVIILHNFVFISFLNLAKMPRIPVAVSLALRIDMCSDFNRNIYIRKTIRLRFKWQCN